MPVDLLTENTAHLQGLRDSAAREFAQNYFLQAAGFDEQVIKLNPFVAPELILKYQNKFLELRTDNPEFALELRRALIKLFLAEGHAPDILEEINDYLDICPGDAQIISLLLKLGYDYKDSPLLIPVLEKAAYFNFKNHSLLKILAGLYLENDNAAAAVHLYENCLKNGEHSPEILGILAELQLQEKNADRSVELFTELAEQQQKTVIDRLDALRQKKGMPLKLKYLLAELCLKDLKPDQALSVYAEIATDDIKESDAVLSKLKEFFKTYPDYPEANFLIAAIHKNKGDYPESVFVLNKLIRLAPELHIDRAAAELHNIVEKMPDQPVAVQSLAEIYMYKKEYAISFRYYSRLIDLRPELADNIVEKARKVLKADPQVIEARGILAKSVFARNNFRRAMAEAEAIIAIDQNNAEAYSVLGRSQQALNEYDAAVASFRTALALDPYNKIIHRYYQEAAAQNLDKRIIELARKVEENMWKYSWHYELGVQYFHRGRLNEAISELQIAVKDNALEFQVHKMQGICYKELGRYDLAVVQFGKALEKTDSIDERLNLLFYTALSYEAFGAHQEALKTYEDILDLDMNYATAGQRSEKLRAFSWVEIRGKALAATIADPESKRLILSWAKNNESEEYAKKNKNKNVDMSFSMEHNNAAVELALKGRLAQAEEKLKLASQMDPQFTIIWNNKAVLAMQAGQLPQAKELLDKAIALNPKVCILYVNLGIYYLLNEQKDLAKENLEKALALDDTMYLTQINLGDIYYEKEDVQKALYYWHLALEQGVLPELAKRRLKYRRP